jgi:hypothetical protein
VERIAKDLALAAGGAGDETRPTPVGALAGDRIDLDEIDRYLESLSK